MYKVQPQYIFPIEMVKNFAFAMRREIVSVFNDCKWIPCFHTHVWCTISNWNANNKHSMNYFYHFYQFQLAPETDKIRTHLLFEIPSYNALPLYLTFPLFCETFFSISTLSSTLSAVRFSWVIELVARTRTCIRSIFLCVADRIRVIIFFQ